MLRRLTVAGTLGLALAAPALALPIQSLSIQPIQVCDDAGVTCAPVDLPMDFVNTIFRQADLIVGVAPTLRLNRSDFLIVDTVAASASPTDEARVLMRGSHLATLGLSAQSTTLNVFFVQDLREVNLAGTPTALGSGVVGIGLINSNGAIVDTGARRDTLAHELTHNLGLNHVAVAQNLMGDGNIRQTPTLLTQIAPTGTLDQVTAAQITDMRDPLFAVNLARVTAHPPAPVDLLDCTLSGFINCVQFRFVTSPNGEKLKSIKLNFAPGTDVVPLDADAVGTDAAGDLVFLNTGPGSRTVLADGTVQLVFPLNALAPFTAGLGPTDFDLLTLPYRRAVISGDFPDEFPLSVFYDFSTGVGTTGLFDELTGGASDEPILIEFAAPAPPSSLVPLTLELSDGEVAAAVPAPGTLALLAIGVACLARRRGAWSCRMERGTTARHDSSTDHPSRPRRGRRAL